MRCAVRFTLYACLSCILTTTVHAGHRGTSYPRVRTFSGGFYGPTQAHYQYQRRYGRPWHGQGGLIGGAAVGAVNGFPAYRGGFGAVVGRWAYPRWGYGYALSPYSFGGYFDGYGTYPPVWGGGFGLPTPWGGFPSPPVGNGVATSPTPPAWVTPPVPINPVLGDAWTNNLHQWEQPIDQLPVIPSEPLALPPSAPAAQVRSIQLRNQGDRRLRRGDYLRATGLYRDAISTAGDLAEPHLHLAIALAGMKRFDDAAAELKVGLSLNPAWPSSGVSLTTLMGEDNLIFITQLKQRTAEWTLHDVRDPDRLFLLGALLYLDQDLERGRIILETAARLSGMHNYLAAFLRADRSAISAGPPTMPGADPHQVPQVPETTPPELPPLPESPQTIPEIPETEEQPPINDQTVTESAAPSRHLDGPAFAK